MELKKQVIKGFIELSFSLINLILKTNEGNQISISYNK